MYTYIKTSKKNIRKTSFWLNITTPDEVFLILNEGHKVNTLEATQNGSPWPSGRGHTYITLTHVTLFIKNSAEGPKTSISFHQQRPIYRISKISELVVKSYFKIEIIVYDFTVQNLKKKNYLISL